MTVLVACGIISCDSPLAPLPVTAPEEFEFSISGFLMATTTWTIKGDTLVFLRYPIEYPRVPRDSLWSIPTAEQWNVFWSAADKAGIRRWKGRYVEKDMLDGMGWRLQVRNGTLAIESSGANAYPDRDGREHKGQWTREFRSFVSALQQLSGN